MVLWCFCRSLLFNFSYFLEDIGPCASLETCYIPITELCLVLGSVRARVQPKMHRMTQLDSDYCLSGSNCVILTESQKSNRVIAVTA
jgi:hypothetical protein